ncbi:MAG: DUF4105 domain-containing protein [Candidatus Rokuibacteriota bacterium]
MTGVLVGVVVAVMAAWSAGAIYYGDFGGPGLRGALAAGFVLATALAFIVLRRRRRTLVGFLVVFAAVTVWWLRIPASNDRFWQPDVSVTPWAEIDGDRVTVHGVRNFDYRTETEFVPRWEDRTYDLGKLDSVDLVAVYWAGPAIAHIFLSFGFAGRDYLAISIETRKEQGESYSTIAGFFKQYELVYIVADERDVIRVRTNYRQPQEDVYVYRVRGPIENGRRVFLDYLKGMNALKAHPQFYNTLTTNCTTGALMHTRVNPGSPPLSWKILLTGYVPEYIYGLGRLDTRRPFTELQRMSNVNKRAHAADQDPAFSQRIRDGLPLPTPRP